MDTPQLDEEKQVRVVLAGACVEQIASKAKGCSACKTPEGKQMFKARVDAAKAEAEQSIERATSEKIDSTVCDLEAEGCVKNGDLKDCRTCAGHMELCMVTPHLDEQMQVRAVTAEDCVVQVAEQASGGRKSPKSGTIGSGKSRDGEAGVGTAMVREQRTCSASNVLRELLASETLPMEKGR